MTPPRSLPTQYKILRGAVHTITAGAISLLIVLLSLPSHVEAGEVRILTPEPQSLIVARQQSTHLVVSLEDPADQKRLRLSSGGGATEEILIDPLGSWDKNGKTYVHYKIELKSGSNRLQLNPGDHALNLNYRPLRSMLTMKPDEPGLHVFHKKGEMPEECRICHEDMRPQIPVNPYIGCNIFSPHCYSCHKGLIFDSPSQHGPAADLLCRACHPVDEDNAVNLYPKGRMDILCFRCHTKGKEWPKKSHIHGPVGTGDCTVCHNPHADDHTYQLWADGAMDLCVSCHRDKRKLSQDGNPNYQAHGILKGRGCIVCHDPHASDNRFQLRHPINELCTDCHLSIDKEKRGHPVKNHPVQGRPDPRRPGRTLACTSCHNPHGSMYRYMLIGDIMGSQVCSKCHQRGTPEKIDSP